LGTLMNENEEQEILDLLQRGLVALFDALDGVTTGLAQRLPSPEKWSIQQCVEHAALSEDFLFSRIQAAKQAETPLLNPEREARIRARGTDRSKPAKAPEVARPQGRFPTLPEALEHVSASRKRTIEFVKTNIQTNLRARITTVPPFGIVSCYETLLLMAEHLLRHTLQIQEVKELLFNPSEQTRRSFTAM
jgi:hypothetical protein